MRPLVLSSPLTFSAFRLSVFFCPPPSLKRVYPLQVICGEFPF
nr:MAG TPA: hypothetical protein [Caudoviricetes sp.]